ncbi:MAG TPA: sulfite exporter TauE/SafE family protein [Ktedonobacterales bacterium]|nr:sulfite exporter TauE/SafE family protein [Ktedonobacterales bacterium]
MDHLLVLALFIAAVSVIAGAIGSLLGLGGGVVVIPILTLVLQIDIHLAIGASIVSVIATSSGAAATFVRDRLTNLRVGMFLEIATTIGAISGAFISGLLLGNALFIIFALVLVYSIYPMSRRMIAERRLSRRQTAAEARPANVPDEQPDRIATALGFEGSYYDPAAKREITYRLRRVPLGFAFMYIAGIASGLLGVGGGIFKVPAMDIAMGMPIKTSSATSTFMIGATAAASAGIYFLRGNINPVIAAPVALGVLVGSLIGTRLLERLAGDRVRMVFIVVIALTSVQMFLRGLGVHILGG